MDVDLGIIYTYEDHFMPPLLESLARSGDSVSMRLLLVDNASERGVAPWTGYFQETQVLCNASRLGYAENLNLILKASSARYALLLNTDMVFEPAEQCVARMVQFMDQHPECGVSGCRLYHADGSDAFPARRFQSPATIVARRLGLARWMQGTIDTYLYADRPRDRPLECNWLSGCFLMVRREAVAQVGGLDAGFRKYFEDVDFCLRMALGGWTVLLNDATYGYHLEQRASRRLWSRDAWLHLKSYVRFLRKWGLHPEHKIVRPPFVAPAAPRRAA
ncbi:MAG: glycosyltransferase [Planctomycetales bacterium]